MSDATISHHQPADRPDSRKDEILDLMFEHGINFSGMGPFGYYLSLCNGKYSATVSDYMGESTLEGVKAFIETVDWAEVERHHGPNRNAGKSRPRTPQ